MKWGIRDVTAAKVSWIGNDQGPILFDEARYEAPEMAKALARIAAQTLETQVFGTDLGCKYQAEVFPEVSTSKVEDLPLKMTTLEALIKLEGS